MLSGETSIGKYPIRAVEYMAGIARRAEQEMDYGALSERRHQHVLHNGLAVDDAIAHSAAAVAESLNAKVILAFTESGSTAARVASYRPRVPILAAVRNETATRRLCLRWGVVSVMVPSYDRVQDMFHQGSELAKSTGYAADNDLAVAVVGMPIGVAGNTNLLRVIRVPEPPSS
jgi:pyruvate kinase